MLLPSNGLYMPNFSKHMAVFFMLSLFFCCQVVGKEIAKLKESVSTSFDAYIQEIKNESITIDMVPIVGSSFGMGKETHPAVNVTHYAAM